MSHPAVAEAAVIDPGRERAERPLAAIVVKEGETVTADQLREHIAPKFTSGGCLTASSSWTRFRRRASASSRRRRCGAVRAGAGAGVVGRA
jgi:acyl-CoA synthetase (AMP-forming)/AMP-acid ligase II